MKTLPLHIGNPIVIDPTYPSSASTVPEFLALPTSLLPLSLCVFNFSLKAFSLTVLFSLYTEALIPVFSGTTN